MGKFIEMTGVEVGLWTVIRRSDYKYHNKVMWVCKCKCGTIKDVDGSALRAEKSLSCGCYRPTRRLPEGEAAFNNLYRSYIKSAVNRGYSFTLSKEEFREIVIQPCFYCGSYPTQEYKSRTKSFIYNGIDRKENTLGYTKENCCSCCKTCNSMKGVKTADDFINHCRKVAEWQKK